LLKILSLGDHPDVPGTDERRGRVVLELDNRARLEAGGARVAKTMDEPGAIIDDLGIDESGDLSPNRKSMIG
jgi:hypothetical protein